MLHEILEDRRVQLVVDRLSSALGDDEAAGAEHGQVARDRRPARMELVGNLAGGAGAATEVASRMSRRVSSASARKVAFDGRWRDFMISILANRKRPAPRSGPDDSAARVSTTKGANCWIFCGRTAMHDGLFLVRVASVRSASVRRGPLDVINDEELDSAFYRFHLQTELLLDRSEDRRG